MSAFIKFDYYETYINNYKQGSKNIKNNATHILLQSLKRVIGNIPWTLETKSTYPDTVLGKFSEKIIGKGHDWDGSARMKILALILSYL